MPSAKAPNNEDEERPESLADFTRFGKYSVFFILLLELMLIPEVLGMTFMVYGGLSPRVVGCGKHNLTLVPKAEVCPMVKRLRNETGCIPELSADFKSISYEFEMYCEKSVEVKGSISLLMLGGLIGSMLFGQLSDIFGRKRMLLIAHVGMGVFKFLASRAYSLPEFAALMFVGTVFTGGHSSIMHVYLLENMPKKHRLWATCLLTYSPNYTLVAGLAYLATDWRTLLQIGAALNVPAFCALMIAFESPRWMIQKGKLDKARYTLRKIELINGTRSEQRLRVLDELVEQERIVSESKACKRRYYFYHLFYTLKMTIYTVVISYALVSTSIIAYATAFNLEYLSGSVYFNLAIYGAFRYLINIGVGILDYSVPKAGRKPIHNCFLCIILILVCTVIVSKLLGFDEPMLVRLCTLCAAALSSQLYMLNAVVTSELFPTQIRNVAASFIQLFSRIGGVLSPHLFVLATVWDPLPYVIMFLFVTANMVLFIAFIPETKHCVLPERMPEKRERFFRRPHAAAAANEKLLLKKGSNDDVPAKNPAVPAIVENL